MQKTKYFHFTNARRPFFEGWYFKHALDGQTLALIPSFHLDANGRREAMLQIVCDRQAYGVSFPADVFSAETTRLSVRIGDSRFSAEGVELRIQRPDISLQGSLQYGPLTPLGSDIMGPFRHIPTMQCNHGVISMRHAVRGTLRLQGETIRLDGAVGYIETDWGHSFPSRYLWTQCNLFAAADLSIMASAATIPLGPFVFPGCICSIRHQGREYRLATYRGAHIKRFTPQWLEIRQHPYTFTAQCLCQQPVALQAPIAGAMGRVIRESPAAAVRYRLFAKGELLFDQTGAAAGFEYASTD